MRLGCEVKYVYAIRTEVEECVATPAIIFIFLPTSSMLPAAEARPAARFSDSVLFLLYPVPIFPSDYTRLSHPRRLNSHESIAA